MESEEQQPIKKQKMSFIEEIKDKVHSVEEDFVEGVVHEIEKKIDQEIHEYFHPENKIGKSINPQWTGGVTRTYALKRDKEENTKTYQLHFCSNVYGLPSVVDLESQMPEIIDQSDLGCCTTCATGAAYTFDQMKQKEKNPFPVSRLKLYYDERTDKDNDTGASISDCVRTTHEIGVVDEHLYPYDTSKFRERPPQNLYDISQKHKANQYRRAIQNLQQLKATLAQGLPIIFGTTIYESFESETVAKTGMVPYPNTRGEQCLGGHALLIVGYDENKKCFKIRNSWGKNWGLNGYFYMPYNYICDPNLTNDMWVISSVFDQ